MSLLEAYSDRSDVALGAMLRQPIKPPEPTAKWNAWSTPLRAVPAAAAEALAMGAEAATYAGRGVVAMRDAPRWSGQTPMEREAADRAAQDGVTGESEFSRSLRAAAEFYSPDPMTAGTAERVVFGVSKSLGKALGYSMMGPAGLALFAADEAAAENARLQDKGVDRATALQAAGTTGVTTLAGVLVPVAPAVGGLTLPNVAKVGGLGLLSGPTSFAAQQQLTKDILSRAGYAEIARQYDPLDPVGLAVSTVAPWAFGVHALSKATVAGKAAPPVAERPPTEAPVPPEAVDAAMAHNLTLKRDGAKLSDEIPTGETLTPAQRVIERAFAEKVTRDFPAAVREYSALTDTYGGKVLNTDIARELSADYLGDRTQSAAVHEPASWFVKRLYDQRLAEMAPGETVVFTSGGTGAGKTSAVEQVPAARHLVDDAGLVYDTNMNRLESAVQKVEQALKAGHTVDILHVQRDPVEALTGGALPRAMRQEREFGSGRTVPLVEHARTHVGAAQVIQQLAEKYQADPRVKITVIDNTRGRGNAAISDLGFVRGFDYNGLEAKLDAAIQAEFDAGRVSEAVFRATKGAPARGAVRDARPAGGSGDQPVGPRAEVVDPAVLRARQELAALKQANESAEAFLARADLPPEVHNLVAGLIEAGPNIKRADRMLADFERTRAAKPEAAPEDVAADVVEAARAGDFVTPEPATAPKPTDPVARSVDDRVAMVEQTMPELKVDDGTTAAAFMERARREAQDGTDVELGRIDADLVRAAAECALMVSAV